MGHGWLGADCSRRCADANGWPRSLATHRRRAQRPPNLGLSFERAPARAAARSARRSACACAHAALAGRDGHHARPHAARRAVDPKCLCDHEAPRADRAARPLLTTAVGPRSGPPPPSPTRQPRIHSRLSSVRPSHEGREAWLRAPGHQRMACFAGRVLAGHAQRQSGRAPRRGRLAASRAAPARCVGLVRRGLARIAAVARAASRRGRPRAGVAGRAVCDVRCPRRPLSSGRRPRLLSVRPDGRSPQGVCTLHVP